MRDGMANWPFIYGCAWFSTCSETVFICDSCHLFLLNLLYEVGVPFGESWILSIFINGMRNEALVL